MTKGKRWSLAEEKALMALLKAGESPSTIAGKLGKTPDSIEHKIRRLGLKEGGAEKFAPSSSFTLPSEVDSSKELPTVEYGLRVEAWVMDEACKEGVTKDRARQLQLALKAAKDYVRDLPRYQDFRRLEDELERQKREIQELKKGEKTQGQ